MNKHYNNENVNTPFLNNQSNDKSNRNGKEEIKNDEQKLVSYLNFIY
jgi:hypothetical protein